MNDKHTSQDVQDLQDLLAIQTRISQHYRRAAEVLKRSMAECGIRATYPEWDEINDPKEGFTVDVNFAGIRMPK